MGQTDFLGLALGGFEENVVVVIGPVPANPGRGNIGRGGVFGVIVHRLKLFMVNWKMPTWLLPAKSL